MAASVLYDAACHGSVQILMDLVNENPSVIADFRLNFLSESLLHVATKCRQLNFVHELMKIDPEVAQELNKDGFRALDIAVIIGSLGIVKELLSFDQDLCLLKGKDRRTALHYAVIKGRVDVIDELLNTCLISIEDVTAYGETALHLAVKGYHFDAFTSLVRWLGRLGKESIINSEDGDGNTVLHLAVLTKQLECIELLVGENGPMRGVIEVNARNSKRLTALDILDIQDSYDVKISRKLESAGAIRAPDSASLTEERSRNFLQALGSRQEDRQSDQPTKDWFKYFKFQKQRDSPSNTRNALLVVAALIATVSFESGVSPPDALFGTSPKSKNGENQARSLAPPPPAYIHPGLVAGSSGVSTILGSHASSLLFLFTNSLGLSASTCIIIYLTSGFPFQRELHISLYSMMFTYGFAINLIIKDIQSGDKTTAYVLLTVACVLPFAIRWLPRWGKRVWKHYRRGHVANTPLPVDS